MNTTSMILTHLNSFIKDFRLDIFPSHTADHRIKLHVKVYKSWYFQVCVQISKSNHELPLFIIFNYLNHLTADR